MPKGRGRVYHKQRLQGRGKGTVMASAEKTTDTKPARRTAFGVAGCGAVWAGLWRLIPHWPNFTPVGGLGLFAGARMRLWQALAVPLAVRAVSDLVL